MSKHIHAELMLQYAQDAMATDKPWELWEYRVNDQDCWKAKKGAYVFHPEYEYRRKPEMVTREITYPKPLTELPDGCVKVWVPRVNFTGGEAGYLCLCTNMERAIQKGIAHLTEGAALAHAKAMMGETE